MKGALTKAPIEEQDESRKNWDYEEHAWNREAAASSERISGAMSERDRKHSGHLALSTYILAANVLDNSTRISS